jgi:glycosyltransferase involved in cell wall biosynthesis
MPTYNGADYLPDALSSVLQQGDPDLEVIAIDDGSTDATPSILADCHSRFSIAGSAIGLKIRISALSVPAVTGSRFCTKTTSGGQVGSPHFDPLSTRMQR